MAARKVGWKVEKLVEPSVGQLVEQLAWTMAGKSAGLMVA